MTTTARALGAWLDDFFVSYFRHRPVNATFIGRHEYDDRLPDFSEAGVADVLSDMASLTGRLGALPAEPLTTSEWLDRTLAAGFLEIQTWEYQSNHFQRGNPATYTGEAVFSVIALFLRPFATLSHKVEAAIARMQAIPTLLAQGQANVRRAPVLWTERAIRECKGALAFFGDGINILMQENGITDPRFRTAADTAAAAFAQFQHYLEAELRCQPAGHYSCGEATLDLLMRKGHFLNGDAVALEAYAREQLAESRAYLEAHAADFGARTWQEALALLADPHPTIDRYYARYGEIWEACRATAEAHKLVTWPDYPVRYMPQPRWARQAAPSLYFLFYRAPAAYDHLPVIDYLVTPIEPDMPADVQERLLRATNDSVIKLNHVVHHGSIGHQIQNWHAYRADSRIGQIAAVDCAARIAMFCAGTMAEGWACYATELMDEVGFLTPLESYSERHGRLRQAARAIVDINLHRGVFTMEDAIAFYQQSAGMSVEAARSEAVKNSMFPGGALMYLTGVDTIHQLRNEMAAAQGASFDLQRFHDQFLSYGSVPVTLIRAMMLEELTHAQR